MSKHYTDEDLAAALEAAKVESDVEESLIDTLGISEDYMSSVVAKVILDAVAPSIAARALRDAAAVIEEINEYRLCHHGTVHDEPMEYLLDRADKIEGKP